MFPNPQDALPLPARPSLEQYKKLAKDFSKAASDSDTSKLSAWISSWIKSLLDAAKFTLSPNIPVDVDRWIDQVEEFTRRHKGSEKKLPLTQAQFILARSHGFESWAKFAKHLEAQAQADTLTAIFERAADAIVTGDIGTLQVLLGQNSQLIDARSTREHRAMLLHYVSANGVEGYRQKTPRNIVQIAKLLLKNGADVDATADVYGGGSTTLMLTATSIHPERAGVQETLLDLLLQHGASLTKGDARGVSNVNACLANGRPRAAEFLADRGAPLDLEAAAGVGRLDVVKAFFDAKGMLTAPATRKQMERGLLWACQYGRNDAARFLLDRGANVHADAGTGMTPLHFAVLGCHPETIQLLLAHGADLETRNRYGGTALGQALWCAVHNEKVDYLPTIEKLINAGATVEEGTLSWLMEQKVSPEMKVRIEAVLKGEGQK